MGSRGAKPQCVNVGLLRRGRHHHIPDHRQDSADRYFSFKPTTLFTLHNLQSSATSTPHHGAPHKMETYHASRGTPTSGTLDTTSTLSSTVGTSTNTFPSQHNHNQIFRSLDEICQHLVPYAAYSYYAHVLCYYYGEFIWSGLFYSSCMMF